MFSIPAVGSVIRVTTKHRNIYIKDYLTKPFIFNVYEGTVLPHWKHDNINTFNMTGTKHFPERNISLENVVELTVLKGEQVKKLQKDLTVRAFKVESKGKTYLVTKADQKYTCTCIGFQYHKKCKHITGVVNSIATK